jgi:hypothetical protein
MRRHSARLVQVQEAEYLFVHNDTESA